MNNAIKIDVDSPNIVNGWKIADNYSRLTVAPPNCYLLNCNMPPVILNVENAADSIALGNLVVKANPHEPACIARFRNPQVKFDFSEHNVIDVGDVNLFACSTVKYNPSMLLQVELNTADGSVVPQNHLVMNAFGAPIAGTVTYKELPPPPVYALPVANVEPAPAVEFAKAECVKCGTCDKELADEDELKAHTHAAHSQRTKPRRCDYCELTFPSKGKWYAHFKTHFDDPSFECAFCSCSFVTQKYLEEHLKFHTAADAAKPAEERTFPCSFCDKEFADRAGVLFHLRIHTSDVVFRCVYCGKMFLNKSELNLHVRTHTGDKAHVCELCKKTFLTTSNLKQHLRIHTGDKPFCCTSCHKTFSNKSNLMQHIKVHTGEKPFGCKFCEKSFTTTSNLTQHLRTHTGDKPYVCDDCGKAFINKSNLSQHRKVHRTAQQKQDEKK